MLIREGCQATLAGGKSIGSPRPDHIVPSPRQRSAWMLSMKRGTVFSSDFLHDGAFWQPPQQPAGFSDARPVFAGAALAKSGTSCPFRRAQAIFSSVEKQQHDFQHWSYDWHPQAWSWQGNGRPSATWYTGSGNGNEAATNPNSATVPDSFRKILRTSNLE